MYLDFYKEGEAEEADLYTKYEELEEKIRALEFKNMLGEEEDRLGAILSINAGAGGTESQDWVNMLFRMYQMWAENHGYKYRVIDMVDGEDAGLKSVTLEIDGDYVYGYLKAEIGVHRLVRISPFDANSRRHTSFASVFVYPLADETIEIDINESELHWETFRSGGKGGQNVNKVETGVRLIWTGTLSDGSEERVVAECQQERSQLQNREKAMMMLKSRVYELEKRIREAEKEAIENSKMKNEWGSQIRSYVMHPYKMIKDVRTNYETSDVEAVMDGELDEFIKSYLMAMSE